MVGSDEVDATKLGYAYVVVCPYCGFHFKSELRKPS